MSALTTLRRRVDRARKFPENTCPASRHVHDMAEQLAQCGHIFFDEPEHCAESLLAVLESLWKARTELAKLRGKPAPPAA